MIDVMYFVGYIHYANLFTFAYIECAMIKALHSFAFSVAADLFKVCSFICCLSSLMVQIALPLFGCQDR
jgi:hypothetical protein